MKIYRSLLLCVFYASFLSIGHFNDTAIFSSLGDLFRSPSSFFSTIVLLLGLLIYARKIVLDRDAFVFFLYSLLAIISLVMNLHTLNDMSQSTSFGFFQMLSTIVILVYFFLVTLVFKYILSCTDVNRLVCIIQISFLMTFIYAFFEFLFYVIPIRFLGQLDLFGYSMDSFDSWIHVRDRDPGMPRVRGFAFEPSYLSAVLAFYLPFLVVARSTFYRIFLILMWAFVACFTYSPTIVLAGIAFYFSYNLKKNYYLVLSFLGVLILFVGLFLVVWGYVYVPIESMESTATRVGSWVATLNVLIENPFFGVGPGLVGYWVIFSYPEFFYSIRQVDDWVRLGVESYSAPTFSSLLTFISSIGLIPSFFIALIVGMTGVIRYVVNNRLARASILSMLIVSLGMNGITFMGYWMFIAMTLSKYWTVLEERLKNPR